MRDLEHAAKSCLDLLDRNFIYQEHSSSQISPYVWHILLHIGESVRTGGVRVNYSQWHMERYIGYMMHRLRSTAKPAESLLEAAVHASAVNMLQPQDSSYFVDDGGIQGGSLAVGRLVESIKEAGFNKPLRTRNASYLPQRSDTAEGMNEDDPRESLAHSDKAMELGVLLLSANKEFAPTASDAIVVAGGPYGEVAITLGLIRLRLRKYGIIETEKGTNPVWLQETRSLSEIEVKERVNCLGIAVYERAHVLKSGETFRSSTLKLVRGGRKSGARCTHYATLEEHEEDDDIRC